MNLYIADLHLGHRNCIQFDHRPFSDIDEMDRALIKLWNDRVNDDDHVYILGDVIYRSGRDAAWYLRQLKGHKHLIVGNHDQKLLQNENAMKYFESVDNLLEITDAFNYESVQVVLCHYPMLEWNHSFHGSYHIFGHIHANVDSTAWCMSKLDHALNAGCMINNYAPASLRELIQNNAEFKKKVFEEGQYF